MHDCQHLWVVERELSCKTIQAIKTSMVCAGLIGTAIARCNASFASALLCPANSTEMSLLKTKAWKAVQQTMAKVSSKSQYKAVSLCKMIVSMIIVILMEWLLNIIFFAATLKSGFFKEELITTPFIARGDAVNAEISHFITPEVLSNAHLWFKLKAHGLEVHLIFKECPNSPSLRTAKATSQLRPLCSLYAPSIQLSAASPLLIHGCVFSQTPNKFRFALNTFKYR